ncbi:hypothetical protein GW17_00053002 [Ensete ventricosum]|nr:hypothetical protein GW17_00053002 [Ensete ventricosum]
MHPLKFPNSGIRAKVFMRKIGFKLYVIRLYRVESFYVFLLRFRREGSEEEGRQPRPTPLQGRPPTARPQPRPPARGLLGPARKGGQRFPRGQQLPMGMADCGQPAGVATPWQGGCQRAWAATAYATGERGVRASFGEKDDPAPMNSKNSEDCPCSSSRDHYDSEAEHDGNHKEL